MRIAKSLRIVLLSALALMLCFTMLVFSGCDKGKSNNKDAVMKAVGVFIDDLDQLVVVGNETPSANQKSSLGLDYSVYDDSFNSTIEIDELVGLSYGPYVDLLSFIRDGEVNFKKNTLNKYTYDQHTVEAFVTLANSERVVIIDIGIMALSEMTVQIKLQLNNSRTDWEKCTMMIKQVYVPEPEDDVAYDYRIQYDYNEIINGKSSTLPVVSYNELHYFEEVFDNGATVSGGFESIDGNDFKYGKFLSANYEDDEAFMNNAYVSGTLYNTYILGSGIKDIDENYNDMIEKASGLKTLSKN